MAMMPPPPSAGGSAGGSLGFMPTQSANSLGIASTSALPPPQPSVPAGYATLRLLEYFDALAGKESQHAHEIHDLNFWRSLTHTFYAPDGVFRFIAFNPSTREQRSFELPTPVIPRYLHTVHLSGVSSHYVSLSSTREYPCDQLSKVTDPPAVKGCSLGIPTGRTSHFVQVDRARMDIEYESGWTVVQRGVMRAGFTTIGGALKLQWLDFIIKDWSSLVPRAKIQRGVVEQVVSEEVVAKIRGDVKNGSKSKDDKKTSKEAGAEDEKPSSSSREDDRDRERPRITHPVERWSMPENPVNEYGMTLRAMRCLEITESVCQLRDLMDYAAQNTLGPMQALQRLAGELRASRPDKQEDSKASGEEGGQEGAAKRKGGAGAGPSVGSGEGNVKTEGQDEEPSGRSSPAKRMR